MKNSCFILCLLFAFGLSYQALAQLPEYNMSDLLVTDCDGYLYDSGGLDEPYENNENFTFTINTGSTITATFLENICIEDGFDQLDVYDGTDATAPLISSITGADFTPPSLVSNSGSMTFVFTSDQSASYCGFAILWNSNAIEPTPPVLSLATAPLCNTALVELNFSTPIACSWLYTDSTTIVGEDSFSVLSTNLNCLGGNTSSVSFEFSPDFDTNCDYVLDLVLGIPDNCDSIWVYHRSVTFAVNDCGINASLILDPEEICAGQCTSIEALVEGCYTYSYDWTPALPNTSGPHQICPLVNTSYSVLITEIETGNQETFSLDVDVTSAGIEFADQSICQSLPGFELSAATPGGEWFGNGIQDELTGFFEPDSAQTGLNTIYYVISESCFDSVLIDVIQIDAGIADAACPGSPVFQLDAIPLGGVWTGPFTTNNGLFDPQLAGSYEVYYNTNGCQDTVIVNVEDIAGTFDLGEMCQSLFPDTLDFSPLGGTWIGPGFEDDFYGIFAPGSIDPGFYDLLYQVNGCDQLFTVEIKEVDTGQRVRTTCPEQDAFIPFPNFSPTGGFWEGNGIIDTNTGMFDPGSVNNDVWSELIYYAPNGCTDTIFNYNRQTTIGFDTTYVCIDEPTVGLIEDNVGNLPWNGVWTGNGVTNPDNNYYEFTAQLAGLGDHLLTYEVNGCADTARVFVFPNELFVSNYGLCSDEASFVLDPGVNLGGTWSGQGIIDAGTGLFDPSLAIEGEQYIVWLTPSGCSDSVLVDVEFFEQASISGLNDVYCFEDVFIDVELSPEGGLFTGPSDIDNINPALIGEGTFQYDYVYEGLYCSSDTSISILIHPPISINISASDTLICDNSGSTIQVNASGGLPGSLFEYTWSDGLLSLSQNNVQPEFSQYYYISADDGCSDSALDSIFIAVLPPIQVDVSVNDTLCFGEASSASAEVLSTGNFDLTWQSNDGATAFVDAGASVLLEVIDLDQGCTFDSLVYVPSYSPISAAFSLNPNLGCIPFESQPLEVIDLSQNAITGIWDLGDLGILEYGEDNPVLSFDTPGEYPISLYVENEGACPDSASQTICIEDPARLFIPDIFSPNGDGLNDILYVRAQGLASMEFFMYDAWGSLVFSTENPDQGWDGQLRGNKAPSGVYVYMLSARLNDGTLIEQHGNVTLVR